MFLVDYSYIRAHCGPAYCCKGGAWCVSSWHPSDPPKSVRVPCQARRERGKVPTKSGDNSNVFAIFVESERERKRERQIGGGMVHINTDSASNGRPCAYRSLP